MRPAAEVLALFKQQYSIAARAQLDSRRKPGNAAANHDAIVWLFSVHGKNEIQEFPTEDTKQSGRISVRVEMRYAGSSVWM